MNWWVNQNVMFRFNYVYGMVRLNSAAAGLGGNDEDIHAFIARSQIVFESGAVDGRDVQISIDSRS